MDVQSTNQTIANATIALAIVGGLAFLANVAIAFFTLRAARATRDEAEATRREAAASLQIVEEMRFDRAVHAAPFLSLTRGSSPTEFNVANLGAGPAILALFVVVDGSDWFESATFNINSGERRDIRLVQQQTPVPSTEVMVTSLTDKPHGEVLFCLDRFKTYYRFLLHLDGQTDKWRSGAPNRPAWVEWMKAQP